MRSKFRSRIEKAIEVSFAIGEDIADARDVLIAALDKFDGDADLEPWLGSPEPKWRQFVGGNFSVDCGQLNWTAGNRDDRELDPAERAN